MYSQIYKPSNIQVTKEINEIVQKNKEKLDAAIDHTNDFSYRYFGLKTLAKSYLAKINDVIAERPQHLLMRVAIGIHQTDVDAAIETYHYLAKKMYTHATPTLFHAGNLKG